MAAAPVVALLLSNYLIHVDVPEILMLLSNGLAVSPVVVLLLSKISNYVGT
jgi:hypothetical protein